MENKKHFLYIITGILGISLLTFLDQWTKKLATIYLQGKEDILWIPGVFQLHYLENRGAAFGIMQNQRGLFTILTLVYLVIAIWFYLRLPKIKKYLPLHFIMITLTAGAIGNFLDRVMQGYVIDFFYFSLINFPVFNVADIFVVCSFIALAICILFIYKEEDFVFLKKEKQEN